MNPIIKPSPVIVAIDESRFSIVEFWGDFDPELDSSLLPHFQDLPPSPRPPAFLRGEHSATPAQEILIWSDSTHARRFSLLGDELTELLTTHRCELALCGPSGELFRIPVQFT